MRVRVHVRGRVWFWFWFRFWFWFWFWLKKREQKAKKREKKGGAGGTPRFQAVLHNTATSTQKKANRGVGGGKSPGKKPKAPRKAQARCYVE